MKFEFVEFYPEAARPKDKKHLGTVHIYAIDCELDIRGIRVQKQGTRIFFRFPHFIAIEEQTGERIRYPFIRWTNEATQQEMIDFLHKEVKPRVLKAIKGQK